ncbi:MAG: hypothetical protein K0S01_3075 [Herbinix sp.]|jgi:hypothetical protein|nr:hypothetical protein [Herbinix sp.]
MEGMNDYVLALKSKIELVTGYFYQQKSQAGYRELIGVIDDITLVSELLGMRISEPQIMVINNKLLNGLQELMNAMLQKDIVLLADIMSYDIMELLDEIMNTNLE